MTRGERSLPHWRLSFNSRFLLKKKKKKKNLSLIDPSSDDTLLDEDLGDEEYDLGNDEEEALLADDYEIERVSILFTHYFSVGWKSFIPVWYIRLFQSRFATFIWKNTLFFNLCLLVHILLLFWPNLYQSFCNYYTI